MPDLPRSGFVLITGASSGIGVATALLLDSRGYRVLAGVRSREAGTLLEAEASSGLLQSLVLDVASETDVSGAADLVESMCGDRGLSALVNNAGICQTGPLEYTTRRELSRSFDINVTGQLAVTQAVLPALRRARGRVVNIGSTSGRIASAFTGAYSASKFALEAVSSTLRLELRDTGVGVTMIEPGVVSTRLWDKICRGERELLERLPPDGRQHYGQQLAARQVLLPRLASAARSPNAVAQAVLTALSARRLKPRYVVGMDARVRILASRILPERIRSAVSRLRRRAR